MVYYHTLSGAIANLQARLRYHGTEVTHQTWQGLDMSDRGPEWNHYEILNAGFIVPMIDDPQTLAATLNPNLPWAEDQFQERVGGEPLNPGNTYHQWPHWRPESEKTLEYGRFTHTYMERFWPRYAGGWPPELPGGLYGIRYRLGDLDDVVAQLIKDPLTRQAYLPIFFPEDTGAVHGGRVPCTLGYHFMMRRDKLHLWYEIRSCDYLRHFRDDIYMAIRLAQWMLVQLQRRSIEYDAASVAADEEATANSNLWHDVSLGDLTFLAHSMHIFMGDRYAL